jgi:hypothetical protein
MLYREETAVCSKIHTKPMWEERRICQCLNLVVHKAITGA